MVASQVVGNYPKVSDPYFNERRNIILTIPTERRSRFIDRILSSEKKAVISNFSDQIYVAALDNLLAKNSRKAELIDKTHIPKDMDHYLLVQRSWLNEEMYLLGVRLGRCPEPSDLSEDFRKYRNGMRFKLFYFFKHPSKMKRLEG